MLSMLGPNTLFISIPPIPKSSLSFDRQQKQLNSPLTAFR